MIAGRGELTSSEGDGAGGTAFTGGFSKCLPIGASKLTGFKTGGAEGSGAASGTGGAGGGGNPAIATTVGNGFFNENLRDIELCQTCYPNNHQRNQKLSMHRSLGMSDPMTKSYCDEALV
jgi:hypothetical protein